MTKSMDFEGRTEREAIAKAAAELGSESFDVEVIEKSGGLFGLGKVKIRVKALTSIPNPMGGKSGEQRKPGRRFEKKPERKSEKSIDKVHKKVEKTPSRSIDKKDIKATSVFIENLVEKMGVEGKIGNLELEESKIKMDLVTKDSNIIIGKKGRNLDSIQVLANVYFHKMNEDNGYWKIIIDSEGYRSRREESLINQAHRVADEAIRMQKSCLMEPMNPFERHLIHRTIGERDDVVTRSEGEGHYKRVRIRTKASLQNHSTRKRR